MTIESILSIIVGMFGCLFFVGGGIGMLRLPDVFSRLHAATKADNLGLGLIVLAGLLQIESGFDALKLVLIWLLILSSSTTTCHLIAKAALAEGIRPWRQS